jgi:transposase-like protein
MGKHHTEDYKLSAVKYALRTDNQVETCEVFDCKRSSLQDWLKLYEETGSPVRDTKKQRTAYKVKKEYIDFCVRNYTRSLIFLWRTCELY